MIAIVVPPTTIRSRTTLGFTALILAVVATAILTRAQSAPLLTTAVPGGLSDGSTLLANGWRLAPAGRHLPVGTLPLNLVLSPDGRYAVVTNNGVNRPSLTVIDVANWSVKTTTVVDHAWYGLAWHPDGTKLYASGAGQNTVREFTFADGVITPSRTFTLPVGGDAFTGGLAVSRDGRRLFVTRVFAMTLSAIDLTAGLVTKTVQLTSEPYTALVSPDGQLVYVSLWGGSAVQVYTADSLLLVGDMITGDHPNAMALSADSRRLFVACGNSAAVWVFDTFSGDAIEQISTNLFAEAPPTSTPNSVAISPDGRSMLVANADINAVAVVDISNGGRSFLEGFIPSGWYPTGAVFSRDGKQIIILNGKGVTPVAPNPLTGGMEKRLLGGVSIVPTPDRTALAEFTRKVFTLSPAYTITTLMNPVGVPIGSPIPRVVGGSSPIKHVFYVIRENRTYDQVLGDLAEGNGDPKLALFGKNITPNAHALAQSFVLFDNFYVDADVSYNGHSYSTAAYATDFIEKMWQTSMMGRGAPYLGEGGGFMRSPFGNISAPARGYLWDYARRANVSVRSYGEFVDHVKLPNGEVSAVEAVPGLRGAVAPTFAGWDLNITDQKRVDNWLQEFHQYEATGTLPQLSIIRLPNDHTAGTRPGAPTPRAMMADNDFALGRMVEAVSASVYWKDSAFFVLEDDAQSGPDHVDSHRSVLLVASPFARRGFVDHTFYTTSGVLRTIELILGLGPMSQFDAAATPLFNAFSGTPNLVPYSRLQPRVPLDEKNLASAFGSSLSLAMDFSIEDRAPEVLLNDIVWRSIRGAHSAMPPPRRSIFVRPSSGFVDDDDDDDEHEP